jgi:trimeric autotransporter adhesin
MKLFSKNHSACICLRKQMELGKTWHSFYALCYLLAIIPCTLLKAQSWNALGNGANNGVSALLMDTANDVLYVGGFFTEADGIPASYIAKWDGIAWDTINNGLNNTVEALSIIDGELYVGGQFTNAAGNAAFWFAIYDGANWTTLEPGLSGAVGIISKYNDEIYAGGLGGIKKWNGSSWVNLGSGINSAAAVFDLKEFNGELYVAGNFATAGGLNVNGIAKWNGSNWSSIGTLSEYSAAYALEIYNNELYIGGFIDSINGTNADNLIKWDSNSLSPVANGVSGGVFPTSVISLEAIGNYLFVGGNFDNASGVSANNIAKWDGTSFSNLETGTDNQIYCLEKFHDKLIAGGIFTHAGSESTNYIAAWDIVSNVRQYLNPHSTLICPCPNNGNFIIQTEIMDAAVHQIIIKDLLGNVYVRQLTSCKPQNELNIQLPSGYYICEINDFSHQVDVVPFVVIR